MFGRFNASNEGVTKLLVLSWKILSPPRRGYTCSARGFNPVSAKLMRGSSMGKRLLSRDGAIVAWHEVPGDSATQKAVP
jgi:hypothetical protein